MTTVYRTNTRSDTSREVAQYKCLEFYNERREADYGVRATKIGEGGQGVVYRCDTFDESSELNTVAIKFYRWTSMVYF